MKRNKHRNTLTPFELRGLGRKGKTTATFPGQRCRICKAEAKISTTRGPRCVPCLGA